MGRLIKFIFLALLPLYSFAGTYNTTSKTISSDKKSACQKSLNSAREDALAQAGTLVISSFSNSTHVNGDKYNSIKDQELKSISVGVAKLVSKNESVEVTKDYQFYCTVNATFSIDEDRMKKAIDQYLASSNKQEKKNTIYIKATGYSEEGQSRYRAFKVATIDAKRNLLNEIKGSELMSIVEAKDGELEGDRVINSAKGTIRFVKIISKSYDNRTKSATVIVGMTKDNLAKNIHRWKNN